MLESLQNRVTLGQHIALQHASEQLNGMPDGAPHPGEIRSRPLDVRVHTFATTSSTQNRDQAHAHEVDAQTLQHCEHPRKLACSTQTLLPRSRLARLSAVNAPLAVCRLQLLPECSNRLAEQLFAFVQVCDFHLRV